MAKKKIARKEFETTITFSVDVTIVENLTEEEIEKISNDVITNMIKSTISADDIHVKNLKVFIGGDR